MKGPPPGVTTTQSYPAGGVIAAVNVAVAVVAVGEPDIAKAVGLEEQLLVVAKAREGIQPDSTPEPQFERM